MFFLWYKSLIMILADVYYVHIRGFCTLTALPCNNLIATFARCSVLFPIATDIWTRHKYDL